VSGRPKDELPPSTGKPAGALSFAVEVGWSHRAGDERAYSPFAAIIHLASPTRPNNEVNPVVRQKYTPGLFAVKGFASGV
jgi:hypothetical protein